MNSILLASGNLGKLKEIKALLAGIPVVLVTPEALSVELRVVEDGETYADNATKKALAYARETGSATLADDTGLEVDVLNGEPGVYSARYASKPGATDADRRQYLLERLQVHPRPWMAQFRCVVALALDDKQVSLFEGICRGEIIPQERGQGGFGYDRIFYFPHLGKTMAELSMEEKNEVSHRAIAVKKTIPLITSWIENQPPYK